MTILKKLFIAPIFAVTLFSTQSIIAQDQTTSKPYNMDARQELKVGIKAGMNYSNVYNEKGQDFVADGKIGFAGGVFVSIPLSDLLGIQPELMYSEKGFKSEGKILGFAYSGKTTLSYLDLPVHLQIKPTENISILAGPQFSYLLSSKYEFNGLSSTQQQDLDDNNNRATLGISAGV